MKKILVILQILFLARLANAFEITTIQEDHNKNTVSTTQFRPYGIRFYDSGFQQAYRLFDQHQLTSFTQRTQATLVDSSNNLPHTTQHVFNVSLSPTKYQNFTQSLHKWLQAPTVTLPLLPKKHHFDKKTPFTEENAFLIIDDHLKVFYPHRFLHIKSIQQNVLMLVQCPQKSFLGNFSLFQFKVFKTTFKQALQQCGCTTDSSTSISLITALATHQAQSLLNEIQSMGFHPQVSFIPGLLSFRQINRINPDFVVMQDHIAIDPTQTPWSTFLKFDEQLQRSFVFDIQENTLYESTEGSIILSAAPYTLRMIYQISDTHTPVIIQSYQPSSDQWVEIATITPPINNASITQSLSSLKNRKVILPILKKILEFNGVIIN